jgi:hypothetical protein
VEKKTILHFDYALIYTGLGEFEKAMDYLNKAYDDHMGDLILGVNIPVFDPLRDLPRFKELLRKLYSKSNVTT